MACRLCFAAQESTDDGIKTVPHSNGKNSDSSEKNTTDKKSGDKNSKTTAKTSKSKDDTNDGDDQNTNGIAKTALISGAVVICLISLELFIYKLVKLKKKQ